MYKKAWLFAANKQGKARLNLIQPLALAVILPVTFLGSTTAFAQSGQIILQKIWEDGGNGDSVILTISGGSNQTQGGSTVGGASTNATAGANPNTRLTLSETFVSGSSDNYTTEFACRRNSNGANISLTGSGLTRTMVVPSGSGITCTVTNTRKLGQLSFAKSSSPFSDPVNGTNAPKNIPGAMVDYVLTTTNTTGMATTANSIVVVDHIPTDVDIYVGAVAPATGPVVMTANGSGLSYTYAGLGNTGDDLSFSNNGGASWGYTPQPDADGVDATVTHIRINPKGAMTAGSNFTLRFRVRVK